MFNNQFFKEFLMAVKVLKLTDSTNLLADVTEKGDEYICKNPVMIVMQEDDEGQFRIGFEPLPLVTDKTINIHKRHVIFLFTPPKEIINGYNAQFGSGIITATSIPDLNPQGEIFN